MVVAASTVEEVFTAVAAVADKFDFGFVPQGLR
jgi:hypothetical protein